MAKKHYYKLNFQEGPDFIKQKLKISEISLFFILCQIWFEIFVKVICINLKKIKIELHFVQYSECLLNPPSLQFNENNQHYS